MVSSTEMRSIDTLWFGVLAALALQVQYVTPAPTFEVQLNERRISQVNDTVYLRSIMRMAKSAEMRNYMRPEVDACDNFYEYACGNWPQINPANGVSPRETNFFDLLTKAYSQKQLKVLKEGTQKGDSEAHAKVKYFYEACDNMRHVNQTKYREQLKHIIAEFGQMPVLMSNGSWQEQDFNWLTTIAKIQHKYGLDIILQLGIRPDFENQTVNMLFVGQPTLAMKSKSMYTSEATKWHRDQYKLDIQKSLKQYLGVAEEQAELVAAEILDFEVQLAKGVMDKKLGKTFKSETTLRTLDEIHDAYAPTLDLREYINIAVGHELNISFYEYMSEYQRNLVEVIKQTPKQQLANYIFYQLSQHFFYNIELSKIEREKACLERTRGFFSRMLDNIVFRRYNNQATVNDINLIWQKLKQAFKEELSSEKLNWMSPMTRKLSLEKLEAMRLQINTYNQTNFTEEYAQLHIDNTTSYVENVQQMLEFETKRILDSLHKPPQPVEIPVMFSYSPAYLSIENLVKLPVALLQPNYLWSDHYPQALKFGTLGYLVAHELIHGFDDMGRDFDHTGNEHSWWDTSSTEAFNERKQCFKRQYSLYRYGGKYLPESELQAENIADNAGVRLAYSAYLNWLESESSSEKANKQQLLKSEQLPSMNYSSKQLFFIGFAQFWCNDANEHFKDIIALVDLHAPAMFRVIGSLANFDEFAKEFKCARGTTMNPEQKCQIY